MGTPAWFFWPWKKPGRGLAWFFQDWPGFYLGSRKKFRPGQAGKNQAGKNQARPGKTRPGRGLVFSGRGLRFPRPEGFPFVFPKENIGFRKIVA